MTVGQAIAAARKHKQISQKELSAMIRKEDGSPISPQYLNDIERDRRNPPGEHLLPQFASALEIPEEYLYFLANQIPPRYRESGKSSPQQVLDAFHAFARSYKRAAGEDE
jgi:transcriptional regulator with XRE-family HTH domain